MSVLACPPALVTTPELMATVSSPLGKFRSISGGVGVVWFHLLGSLQFPSPPFQTKPRSLSSVRRSSASMIAFAVTIFLARFAMAFLPHVGIVPTYQRRNPRRFVPRFAIPLALRPRYEPPASLQRAGRHP